MPQLCAAGPAKRNMSQLRGAGPAKKACHSSARPAREKKHVTASGRLAGGRLGWTYRDFPISQAQPATAGRPQAEKNMSQLFPASGKPARPKKHGTAPCGRPSEKKHVTAPRGRPSGKTCHGSGLRPRRPKAVTCSFSDEKSKRMDLSNESGGPATDHHRPPPTIDT